MTAAQFIKPSGVIAVGLAVLLSLSCERNENQAEWWRGEQERTALSHQLELLQYRLELRSGASIEGKDNLSEVTRAISAAPKSLYLRQQALSAEVAALEKQWPGFRASTIQAQRGRAIGKTFETLGLASGRKFQSVSVAAITDGGVTIRHADGSARLRFADLDAKQQLFFGLEADSSLAAAEKESQTAIAYQRQMDIQMAAIHQQEKVVSEITRRAEQAAQEKWSQLAVRYVADSRTELFAQAAISLGARPCGYSSYYPRYRSYRNSRPTYRYIYNSRIPSCHQKSWHAVSSSTIRGFNFH